MLYTLLTVDTIPLFVHNMDERMWVCRTEREITFINNSSEKMLNIQLLIIDND